MFFSTKTFGLCICTPQIYKQVILLHRSLLFAKFFVWFFIINGYFFLPSPSCGHRALISRLRDFTNWGQNRSYKIMKAHKEKVLLNLPVGTGTQSHSQKAPNPSPSEPIIDNNSTDAQSNTAFESVQLLNAAPFIQPSIVLAIVPQQLGHNGIKSQQE